MEYVRIGTAPVSRIGVGTAAICQPYAGLPRPRPREAERVIYAALDAGITFFDTAPTYGSEALLGRILRGKSCFIATKVKMTPPTAVADTGEPLEDRRTGIFEQLHTSLCNLRNDILGAWLIHDPDLSALPDSAWDALEAAQRAGWVRRTGASVYGNSNLSIALTRRCSMVEVAYNILDRRPAALLPAPGVAVVARSALLRGALTATPPSGVPAALSPLLAQFRAAAASLGMAPDELALRFVLSAPWVDVVLIGPRSTAELERSITHAERGPLPADALAALDTLRCDDAALISPRFW